MIRSLDYFGIRFDEGASTGGDSGAYGPYHQSERAEIYHAYVKRMVRRGQAYPCFMTSEEIDAVRQEQENNQENPGIYGKWAKSRDLSYEEIEAAYCKLYHEAPDAAIQNHFRELCAKSIAELKRLYDHQKSTESRIGDQLITYIEDGVNINTKNVTDVAARIQEKMNQNQ